jgi:hypothetical protein
MEALHFVVQYQLIVLVRKKEVDAKKSVEGLGKIHFQNGKIHDRYIGVSSRATIFVHKQILRETELVIRFGRGALRLERESCSMSTMMR